MTSEKQGKDTLFPMPCGKVINLARPRSEGVLGPEEASFLRRNNVPLSYDPLQVGWLPAAVTDDFHYELDRAPGRGARRHSAVAYEHQVNALHPQYRLRAWEPSDLKQYKALLDDPQLWKYMPEPYPAPLTDETAAALIELSNNSNHHQVYAALRDSKIVGQVRLLYDVDETDPAIAEISYWLGRAFRGKGIGSDLVRLFSARCFSDNPGIRTLTARVHRENQASARILQKSGFVLRGADPKDANWQIFCLDR